MWTSNELAGYQQGNSGMIFARVRLQPTGPLHDSRLEPKAQPFADF